MQKQRVEWPTSHSGTNTATRFTTILGRVRDAGQLDLLFREKGTLEILKMATTAGEYPSPV